MTKNYRDARTGQYTTAADAAARPAETVAETSSIERLIQRKKAEDPEIAAAYDMAELRRLLAAATARPWMVDVEGDEVAVIVDEGDELSDHDLFGDPAEPVPCDRAGCWCETYDRATHGPVIDLPDQTCPDCGLEHLGADCQQPDLLEGAS